MDPEGGGLAGLWAKVIIKSYYKFRVIIEM
jgi:hypothetical protein